MGAWTIHSAVDGAHEDGAGSEDGTGSEAGGGNGSRSEQEHAADDVEGDAGVDGGAGVGAGVGEPRMVEGCDDNAEGTAGGTAEGASEGAAEAAAEGSGSGTGTGTAAVVGPDASAFNALKASHSADVDCMIIEWRGDSLEALACSHLGGCMYNVRIARTLACSLCAHTCACSLHAYMYTSSRIYHVCITSLVSIALRLQVNPEIGEVGLSAIRRGGWDPDVELTLGQAGPSRNQNPFWILFPRNNTGSTFANGDPPEAVNALALALARWLKTGTRGMSEYTLRERLSRYPRSYSLFDALPMKVGLGRFIDGAHETGGWCKTVHIGVRLAVKHATLLRLACEAGGSIIRLDFAVEVPCIPAGLEVYTRPEGFHPGARVTWYTTFDGEHSMWAWTQGNPDASEECAAECAELLAARDDQPVSTAQIVNGWAAGRRPCKAEIELVRHRHKSKEMEYFALHHHVSPLLPPGFGQAKDRKLSHVAEANGKAKAVLSELQSEMDSLVADGNLRVRHENVYSQLTHESLGLPASLPWQEYYQAVIEFCTNDCLAMHLHRHHTNAISHGAFHSPESFLLSAQLECDALDAMCQDLLTHSIGGRRIGLTTSLARLGLTTEIALGAQLARVHQRLLCYREIDRDAINLELRLNSFLSAQPSTASSEQFGGAESVVYNFVCSLTVECMRYCLRLLPALTTGKRDVLVDRLSRTLLRSGDRTLTAFASVLDRAGACTMEDLYADLLDDEESADLGEMYADLMGD